MKKNNVVNLKEIADEISALNQKIITLNQEKYLQGSLSDEKQKELDNAIATQIEKSKLKDQLILNDKLKFLEDYNECICLIKDNDLEPDLLISGIKLIISKYNDHIDSLHGKRFNKSRFLKELNLNGK